MTDIYSFGIWVRRRRRALDMTQDQLADLVGCAPITVRKIESDERRPSPQMAERLAQMLQIASAERARFIGAALAELAVDRLADPTAVIAAPLLRLLLPRPATALVGRDEDLAALLALLAAPSARLVTLIGPGGIGKTRLALAALGQLGASSSPSGVIWLESLADEAALLATIARGIGIAETAAPPLDRLRLALGDRPLLLLLDNLEQLAGAALPLGALLTAAPALRLLVTSRAPLQIRGERIVPLGPLSAAEAALLYAERAGASGAAPATDGQAVAALVAALDRLPLAIELAAARARSFPPDALLARLAEGLDLLSDGPRDLPERQRTLRATIGWSYALLSAEQAALFRRISVCPAGVTPQLAAALADRSEADAALALAALVDQSLLALHQPTGQYRMLATIRAYAGERLASLGETELANERHLRSQCALAERAAPALFGAEQRRWLAVLAAEQENIAALLRVAPDGGERDRLVCALWWHWYRCGMLREGGALLERVARTADDRALAALAGGRAAALALRLGSYAAAAALAQRSIDELAAFGDAGGAAFASGVLAAVALLGGDLPRAVALANAALPPLSASGQPWAEAVVTMILATAARYAGDDGASAALLERCLHAFETIGDDWGIAFVLGEIGALKAWQQEWRTADVYFRASLEAAQQLGDQTTIAHALHRLGRAARQLGEHGRALVLLEQQLALFETLGDRAGMLYAQWELAALALALGRPDLAALSIGRAQTLTRAIGVTLSRDATDYAAVEAASLAALGAAQYAEARARGSLLDAGALGRATIAELRQ